MKNTLDKTLNALTPGQQVRLSGDTKCWVTAERSGNGKTLRFVRHTPTTSTVFRTVNF